MSKATLGDKLVFGFDVLKARFLKKRLPFAVSWHLTYRCNYNCVYCAISENDRHSDELNTEEVLSVINTLRTIGAHVIHFCGGECLLRNDFEAIVRHCRRKSILVGLISNGALVPRHSSLLPALYVLKLSFDGPPEIHNALRGKGSYEQVIAAVRCAQKIGVKVILNTTLTKLNINALDVILQTSKELSVPVKFSPLNYVHSGAKDIAALVPSRSDMQEAVGFIMRSRLRRRVINSDASLRYLRLFPQGAVIKQCVAGNLFCHIKPNGDVHPCERRLSERIVNCRTEGIVKAFFALPQDSCKTCWCTSTLELNFIYSLSLSALKHTLMHSM